MSEEEAGEIINIRVELKGKVKERFLKIKEEIGYENNTEVIRYLINEYYKRLFEKETRG